MSGRVDEETLRIAVLGAGRMGRELVGAIAGSGSVALASVWVRDAARLIALIGGAGRDALGHAVVGGDLDAVLTPADVAVDFTLPAATPAVLDAVLASGTPLVCGVSGLNDAILRKMEAAAASVPLLYDRNLSLGIAVLQDLVQRAATALGREFVAAIHETHHVHKVDAPSGTALKLGETLAAARNQAFSSVFRYAEGGMPPRTSPDEILCSVTRRGDVAGEHTVAFQSAAETLELNHKVSDRRVFANGALLAARWLILQKPGLYRMSDIFS